MRSISPLLQKGFPEIKEKNQGKFTAWAKKNGFKDACSAASAVMKAKDGKYSNSLQTCLLYTSPSPRDRTRSRMPSSA